jgi:LmbE family N-acetylglucosaminyl deacetylase
LGSLEGGCERRPQISAMPNLRLFSPTNSVYKVLCLGAHADDIEIGCGGAVLSLLEGKQDTEFCWFVFSASHERGDEAHQSAHLFLKTARWKSISVNSFRESFFPCQWAEIKECFERLKRDYSPNLVFTHYRNDLHQDHRLISELTWNTFRNHLILEYEIPKYDGDLGMPNFFVPLDRRISNRKIQYILESFKSQAQRSWFDQETFLSMLRLRGLECNAPSKYAEAFYCRKTVLGLSGTHDDK